MEDYFSYGAHFALRVLVLPVHPIRTSEYSKRLTLLRQNTRIPLADVPPSLSASSGGSSSTSIHALLAPTPTSRGFLNLEFVEAWDKEQSWLEDFQIHRRIVAVIGILDCEEWANEADGLAEGATAFEQQVQGLELERPIFAKRCYAFNPAEEQKDNTKGLVVIPSVGDAAFYMHTLLAELSSGILAGLGGILASLDGRSYIPSPRERPRSNAVGTSTPDYFSPPADARLSVESSAGAIGTSYRGPSPHIFDSTRTPSPSQAMPKSRITSMSGPSGSAPVQLPEAPDAKARKKTAGRAAKLRGDLYCVAGRVTEGMNCYTEAITHTKNTGDLVWQAAATEANILAQVYNSWLHNQSASRTPSHTPRPSLSQLTTQPASAPDAVILQTLHATLARDLPVQFQQVFALYGRGNSTQRNSLPPNGDGPTPVSLPSEDPEGSTHPLLIAEATLRCARLQLAILLQQGIWDTKTTSLLATSSTHWPSPSSVELFKLSLNSPIKTADISATLEKGYEYISSPRVTAQNRIRLLSSYSNIFAKLHQIRRRATIFQELAFVAAGTVAQRKQPGDQPSADQTEAATVVKSAADSASNNAIMQLLDIACDTYGVPVVATAEITSGASDNEGSTLQSDVAEDSNASMTRFGWPDLQVALVKDAIHVAELLPDYQGAIRFTMTALRELQNSLSSTDQYKFSQNISKLFAAASKRGSRYRMAYWGPQDLVMSIEVASLPSSHVPFEHPISDAAERKAEAATLSFQDAVVYNPMRKSKANSKPVLVQDELAEFFVTLQNPFLFELDIDSIEVVTSGASCIPHTLTSSVPPSSFHTIRISCTPTASGTMVIHGCKIRLSGCDARVFYIPLGSEEDDKKKVSQVGTTFGIKDQGLAARNKTVTEDRAGRKESDHSFLECIVIPPQPMLQVTDTSLTQGALMLYEGETCSVRLAVSNSSSLEVNYLKMSLEDSFTTAARDYLSENEVPEIEAYCIATEIANRPTLSRIAEVDERFYLKPDALATLSVTCLGRLGLTDALIAIDYASIQAHADQSVFYTRQLFVPINVSVQPTIQLVSCALLPVSDMPASERQRHTRSYSITSIGRAMAVDNVLEDSLRDMEEHSSCLFVLEVFNSSDRQTFEVVLESADGLSGRIKQKIEAGATANLLLPISRFTLPDEQVLQPIPSLSTKQFVVGKEQTGALERELFWYREALLRNIKLAWRELGTRRTGQVNLQGLVFTDAMLPILRLADLDIQISLIPDDEDEVASPYDIENDYCVECGHFQNLHATIRNRSTRRLRLQASLQLKHIAAQETLFDAGFTPSAGFETYTDSVESEFLSRHVLIDGLACVPLRPLDPGKIDGEGGSQTVIFPVCFLSKGTYNLVCSVTEESDPVISHHRRVAVSKAVNVVVQ